MWVDGEKQKIQYTLQAVDVRLEDVRPGCALADCGRLRITRDLGVSCLRPVRAPAVGKNVQVRALLITVTVTFLALTAGAAGVDFGTAIHAEYRLARTLRAETALAHDPSVGILGFPFITQALGRRYDEVELRAYGVDQPIVDKAELEATLHGIDLKQASWLIRPDAPMRVDKVESRIILDSTHLGRFMGIKDLIVEAPPRETNDATGGTTESGISSSQGLVFTGTPKSAGFDKRVSVSVDLSMAGPDKTTLVFTATDVITGPGTADQAVPDDKRDAVLAAFTTTLPRQKLPFGIAPTREGARGSDVIIEGIAQGATIRLSGFRQA